MNPPVGTVRVQVSAKDDVQNLPDPLVESGGEIPPEPPNGPIHHLPGFLSPTTSQPQTPRSPTENLSVHISHRPYRKRGSLQPEGRGTRNPVGTKQRRARAVARDRGPNGANLVLRDNGGATTHCGQRNHLSRSPEAHTEGQVNK
jgi:hypothetical protein